MPKTLVIKKTIRHNVELKSDMDKPTIQIFQIYFSCQISYVCSMGKGTDHCLGAD